MLDAWVQPVVYEISTVSQMLWIMLILEIMCDKCVLVSMSRLIVKKTSSISRYDNQ